MCSVGLPKKKVHQVNRSSLLYDVLVESNFLLLKTVGKLLFVSRGPHVEQWMRIHKLESVK